MTEPGVSLRERQIAFGHLIFVATDENQSMFLSQEGLTSVAERLRFMGRENLQGMHAR